MKYFSHLLALTLLSLPFMALAETEAVQDPVTNIAVERVGNDDLQITWDLPADAREHGAEGVLVQWSESFGEIGPEYSTRQRLQLGDEELTIRGKEFEQNIDYYFFVALYKRGGFNNRETYFMGCGKALRWEDVGTTTYNAEEIPVNCDEQEETTTSLETDVLGLLPTDEFGKMAIRSYETDIMLAWKKPQMGKNQYEGYEITISENSDMTDPVVQFQAGPDNRSARITKAMPGRTYYVQGAYYVGTRTFGESEVYEFTMDAEYDRSQQLRFERLVANRIIRLSADIIVAMDGEAVVVPDEDEEVTVTTSTTTSYSSSSSSSNVNYDADIPSDKTAIQQEIKEIRVRLRALMKALRDADRT